MTPELAALLADCARFLRSVEGLYDRVPPRFRAAHLTARAHLLAERCEAAVRDANLYEEEAV